MLVANYEETQFMISADKVLAAILAMYPEYTTIIIRDTLTKHAPEIRAYVANDAILVCIDIRQRTYKEPINV